MTYIWLRQQQLRSQDSINPRKILGGVIFYLNELEPSGTDMINLKADVQSQETDIPPMGNDFKLLMGSNDPSTLRLSDDYLRDRSIRIIPYNPVRIQEALNAFDGVVNDIESRVLSEMNGVVGLRDRWKESAPKERNCTACDAKTICPNAAPSTYRPTVP